MADFPQERFSSSEALIRQLQERSDDFEGVTMMVANDLFMTGPEGQRHLAKNCCCLIKTCTGESILIHREEFETLLNDGILQRLKIPISLVPFEAR